MADWVFHDQRILLPETPIQKVVCLSVEILPHRQVGFISIVLKNAP